MLASRGGGQQTAKTTSGAFEGGTPFRLYGAIAWAQATGRLVLEGSATYEVWFRRGNPELVRTSDPDLSQQRFLVARGLVPEDRIPAGDAPIEALVASGGLAPMDGFQALGGYLRGLLARAVLLEEGRYAWHEGETATGGIQLGERWMLLTAIGRRIPFASLERRLGPRIGLPVRQRRDVELPWGSLGLNAVETRILSRFDGGRSVAECMAAHPEEAHAALQLVCFLAEVGFVSFGDEEEAGEGPFAGLLGEEAAPTGPDPVQEAMEHLARMEGQDFFERLGVGQGAGSAAIRKAYLQLARTFHPDMGGARGELRRVREQITALLNEAYDTIGEDESRKAYLQDLRDGGREKVDVSSILEAERKLHLAVALIRERRFAQAVEVLDEAIALHDAEAESWAYRAYATLAAAEDRQAAKGRALADLQRAQSLGDNSPTVFLLAARIANLLGDGASAIRYYGRCLELAPGHQEAQRELRLAKSRQQ